MFSKIGGFFRGTKKEEIVTAQVDYDRSNGVFICDKMKDSDFSTNKELVSDPQKLNELYLINILSNWNYSNMCDENRPDYASTSGGIGNIYFYFFRVNEQRYFKLNKINWNRNNKVNW